MKGKIKSLRNYWIVIRWLGWRMPALSETTIDDAFDFRAIESAEQELYDKIVAGDIQVLDASDTVLAASELHEWIRVNWADERALPLPTYRIHATFEAPVPGTGTLFLSHPLGLPHSDTGFVVPVASRLKEIFVSLNTAEPTNTYDIRIYSNPTTNSPALTVGGKLSITPGSTRLFQVLDLADVEVGTGEYGIIIERTAGTGQSAFIHGTVILVLEEQ
jgi:hypothetical protein